MASNSSSTSPSPSTAGLDPTLRILLRYTISPKEYSAVHDRLIKRTPKSIQDRAPLPSSYENEAQGQDDFNAAAVRASLRLFLSARAGLKLWESIKAAIARRRNTAQPPVSKSKALLSGDTRLSISLALLLLSHRVLHRFLTRLRANLLNKNSQPFRRRNPRISKALTARLAPAVGASLAGFALAVSPADQLRITVAIYASTRAGEFVWNALEAEGWFKDRPWWFGSWLLMPGVFGELLYAFVFETDCFPKGYGDFIMRFSDTYLQKRPADYPVSLAWPDTETIVRGLEEVARLHYPPYESPILYPKATLPASLATISPVASGAHPGISNLACAVLHPSEPSCLRTYLKFYLDAFPRFAKFFAVVFAVFSLPRYKAFIQNPGGELNKLAQRVLRMSLFITGAIATSWGSICLFQILFKRRTLPKGRFFLGGFVGGFWALLVRKGGRGQFLYSLRTALDSTHKLGTKKGWWRGPKGGDLLVTVASLAAINIVYEKNPEAINSGLLRKLLAGFRGDGWVDKVKLLAEDNAKKEKEKDDHEL